MNGGWLPMLGEPRSRRPRENTGVKNLPVPSIHPVPTRGGRAGSSDRPRQAGFTLIEVMVALIVLVLGVLGAAAMTLTAIRDSKQSGLRSTASALAYEVSDLMRANPGQEAIFKGTTSAPVATCWTTGCSFAAGDMASNDLYEWRRKLQGPNGLPNGDAVICRDSTKLADSFYPACDNATTSPLVVKLKWDEKNNNARDAATRTGGLQSVTTRYLVVTIQPY